MRLKIAAVSFTIEENWIFKLTDGTSEYYILSETFYKSKGLRSPIGRKELDSWDIGFSVICETMDFDGTKVVTKII